MVSTGDFSFDFSFDFMDSVNSDEGASAGGHLDPTADLSVFVSSRMRSKALITSRDAPPSRKGEPGGRESEDRDGETKVEDEDDRIVPLMVRYSDRSISSCRCIRTIHCRSLR